MYVSDRPLSVQVTLRGEALICRLVGSATMDACDLLNEQLARIAQQAPKLLVLDLSDLQFICSLGLGSIVAAYLRAKRYGGKFILAAPLPAVAEMLELTKLTVLFPVSQSVEEALGA